MKNLLHLVWKDFMRKWKNPVVILGFLCIPFVFTLIFGFVFGSDGEEALPRVKILAVDKDNSLISGFILRSLTQGDLNELIELEEVEEDEGYSLLDKGKASALLVIPKGFGENIWDGKKTEILLVKNPAEQFLPQIAEEILDTLTLILSSLRHIFADELNTIRTFADLDEFPDEAISTISIKLKNRIEGVTKYVFPPVISLKQQTISEEKEEVSDLSISAHILPAIALMFLLFICNTVFEDSLREKETGTLTRIRISPASMTEYIWSKIFTSALIGIICTALLILLGQVLFSIDWGDPLAIALLVLSLNILIAGFIAFLYAFVRTERQAGALLTTVILLMSMLGGSMIPVENFPPIVASFSKLTLNYWGITSFKKLMRGESIAAIFPILIFMVFTGVVFSIVGSFFLNNNLKKGIIR
ncbi:MAG: ABC transporter permease [Candidatus Aminicenantes bacterium]